MTMRRLFTWAVALYPADFRARFEIEMLSIIGGSYEMATSPTDRVACVVREAGGLIAGACREWIAKVVTDPVVRARRLPDCRLMRPVGVTRAEWAAGLAHVTCREVES
jgi:hypothetical protein